MQNPTPKDPLESATFTAYRNTLAQQPTNEELKKQIRTIDLELRREFFRQKTFTAVGAVLLLICVGIFLTAGKTAVTLHRRLPQPQQLVTLEDTETKWTRLALWGVVGLTGILVVASLALNFASRSPLPSGWAIQQTHRVRPMPPTSSQLKNPLPITLIIASVITR